MVDKTTERVPTKAGGFFGRLLETLAGQAKKAKGGLEGKSGLQPILALESRLPIPKLKQLIAFCGDRFLLQNLTQLKDKTVLEIGEGPLRFQKNIAEQKPKFLAGIVIDGVTPQSLDPSSLLLKGTLKSIPFENQFFDFVVALLTTSHQGDVVSAFKEMGRILAPEGIGLIVDFHPFGLYAKTGTQRLRSIAATIRGLEDYYKMCRVAGLSIVDLHEGFVDDTLRNQFVTLPEMEAFREIKGTPLVLFLRVKKTK